MTIHQLLESVKNLEGKIKTEVIDLKDLREDKFSNEDIARSSQLELKVSRIARDKERRDRVGPFFSQILCNTSSRVSGGFSSDFGSTPK